LWPRDEPGGCLLTGQAVSGTEVAASVVRAPARNVGTCRPVVAVGSLDQWVPPTVAMETPSGGNCEGPSSDAGHRGGPSRGGCEAR
jgi:hypothetical protein